MRLTLPACFAIAGAAAATFVLTGCSPSAAAPGRPVLGAAAPMIASDAEHADGQWGTIQGKATWAGTDDEAKPTPANVDKDQAVCLKNGPIHKQDYVVNPKNKGVQWVVVWLVDADDYKKELPINPALPAPTEKVVLDQPCCQFVPHIITLREGQTLTAKNSGTIPHNTKIDSPGDNPSLNPLLPPGQSVEIPGWKAATAPSTVSCSIHGWMTGYIRVFNHPYFAVTDADGNYEIKGAPAGKYHIVAWQETVGFLSKSYKKGDPIDIKPDGVTEVNFEVKPKAGS